MLHKSQHFDEQWKKRVGGATPSTAQLDAMIDGCVLTQQYRECKTSRGRQMTIMALYWDPDKKLIFKVNMRRGEVVTVLTPEVLRQKYARRGGNQGL